MAQTAPSPPVSSYLTTLPSKHQLRLSSLSQFLHFEASLRLSKWYSFSLQQIWYASLGLTSCVFWSFLKMSVVDTFLNNISSRFHIGHSGTKTHTYLVWLTNFNLYPLQSTSKPYLTPDGWLRGLELGRQLGFLFKSGWDKRGGTCGLRWPYPVWRCNTSGKRKDLRG